MKKIDRETVQRILDAADIVEVVSDFVSLKKRGVNYIGLCPFHNERTPSFSVSKSKGICKCFSCGKGGSPVNFIMEHEQMTYYEALKWLAKKYNIEIREREMTDQEKEIATERESLLAVNEFALQHFQKNMSDTPDGRDIGLAYFRERGINDLMIQKFKLGYALESNSLYEAAASKGYQLKYLLDTGLCSKNDRGVVYDRFKGRVIYPVFTVSGRVIAFGGRTLRSDKTMAKYVNSPESLIYHKSNELYGLYQAKSSIVKNDKCILVEGYMDVISMHQVGIENVVASSGTSLTDGQIRLIHRFTNNVTVIYDSDAAGIKASLRGIDMLLSEGLNIKVLLLPDGEDPDSFAQSHSSTEVLDYIKNNETDFIRFKTKILLADSGNDPVQRSKVITDIVKSISCIPDPVTRAIYLGECSRMLSIEEKVLSLQLSKALNDSAEKKFVEKKKQEEHEAIISSDVSSKEIYSANQKVKKAEENVVKYIIRYGMLSIAQDLQDGDDEDNADVTVLNYIMSELEADDIVLSDKTCAKILNEAVAMAIGKWVDDKGEKLSQLNQKKSEKIRAGQEEIRQKASSMADIELMESNLMDAVNKEFEREYNDFSVSYLYDFFLSHPDDSVRALATELANDKYKLSKVYTKYVHVETEEERLNELVVRSVMELKYEILDQQIADANKEMKTASAQRQGELMREIFEMYQLKSQFSKYLGDRIVNPR